MDRIDTCRPAWHTGHTGGHVESYFIKCNDVANQRAVWIKFTFFVPQPGLHNTDAKQAPAQAVGEVWAIWFDGAQAAEPQAWKDTFALADCLIAPQPLHLQFGANHLHSQASEGHLQSQHGLIRWQLQWDAGAESLAHFPHDWMYQTGLPKSKLTAPYPSSLFHGWIELNGQRFEVNRCPGTMGHNWGREHAWHYAWGHCNAFDGHGPDTWFEGASSRLRIGPWTTPYLSLAHLQIEGQRYAFHRLRHIMSKSVTTSTTRWQFQLESDEHVLLGELHAPPQRFICLHYFNPNGALGYCLNTKLADAELELRDQRNRPIAKLRSTATAALEVLVRNPHHGITPGA